MPSIFRVLRWGGEVGIEDEEWKSKKARKNIGIAVQPRHWEGRRRQ